MNNYKIRVAVLSCVLLLGIAYTIYQYLGLSDEYDIEDADALNAVKWLRLADDKDFAECKKSAASNADKWFGLFQNNRKSLGEIIFRRLKSKATDKKGVYKIVFNSSFENAPKIYETIWISPDAKVWQVKYSYLRRPYPTWRSKDFGIQSENTSIKNVAYQAIAAMKNLDVDFFDQVMLRSEKFRFGKRIVKRLKKQRERTGAPYKYQLSSRVRYTRTFPGLTEITGAITRINCFYKIKGKPYRQSIVLILYKDNSIKNPRWEIHRFFQGKVVAQKKRKPKKKAKAKVKNDKK
jgi:hypothetical protein